MSELLLNATGETVYMVFASGLFSGAFGLGLGILLFVTRPKGLSPRPYVYRILDIIANVTRSIPFIILLIMLLPITRFLVGTSIGTTAAIVPLSLGAIPFVARIIEAALLEVPTHLIEAGLAMGATTRQIIMHIVLPEARSAIINGLTVTLVTLVSFSAMAGVVGGGGLGDIAIRYGYQRFDTSLMFETVLMLVVFVQFIQFFGNKLSRY